MLQIIKYWINIYKNLVTGYCKHFSLILRFQHFLCIRWASISKQIKQMYNFHFQFHNQITLILSFMLYFPSKLKDFLFRHLVNVFSLYIGCSFNFFIKTKGFAEYCLAKASASKCQPVFCTHQRCYTILYQFRTAL